MSVVQYLLFQTPAVMSGLAWFACAVVQLNLDLLPRHRLGEDIRSLSLSLSLTPSRGHTRSRSRSYSQGTGDAVRSRSGSRLRFEDQEHSGSLRQVSRSDSLKRRRQSGETPTGPEPISDGWERGSSGSLRRRESMRRAVSVVDDEGGLSKKAVRIVGE